MALELASTSGAAAQKVTALVYGNNGTGKTTFASTWPNPVFLVPWLSRGEMKTLAKQDFPVIYFKNLRELNEQTSALCKAVDNKELVCDTIVVDNLTAMQIALKEELKATSGKAKLEWEDWDKLTSTFMRLLESLHKLPPHIIWITHEKIVRIDDDRMRAEFNLMGQTRDLVPNFADMILHADVTDLKAAGSKYRIYLKGHDIWPCRIRGDKDDILKFPAFLENPTYDKLAKLMGWKSCAEIEGREQKEEETTDATEAAK